MLEGVIQVDLFKNNIPFRKLRNDSGAEINLCIGNDLYEIKNTEFVSPHHCRWLLNKDFLTSQGINPNSLNVIYAGETRDLELSQKSAVNNIKEIIEKNGGKASNKVLNEMEKASTDKHIIHYINVFDFLRNVKESAEKDISY